MVEAQILLSFDGEAPGFSSIAVGGLGYLIVDGGPGFLPIDDGGPWFLLVDDGGPWFLPIDDGGPGFSSN